MDRLGLTASIEELVEKLASSSGMMQISADIEPFDGRLSKDAEISCYRLIQESTSNIVKHAVATKVYVELWCEDRALQITVRDNGRGMDEPTARQARGLGLTSITERVRILGGTLLFVGSGFAALVERRRPFRRGRPMKLWRPDRVSEPFRVGEDRDRRSPCAGG